MHAGAEKSLKDSQNSALGGKVLKRGRKILIISVVILVVSFIPMNWLLPEWWNSGGYYDLGPGAVDGPIMHLPYLGLVELRVSISGANRDVYFYITDSNDKRVFDAGRVYDGYHLEWYAPFIGSYKLNFDNTMSWTSHKYVNWSTQLSYYRTLFFLLGGGLLIIGIIQILREEKAYQKIKARLFKEPESTVKACQYCGVTIDKTLHKCPHCGAPQKDNVTHKEKKP